MKAIITNYRYWVLNLLSFIVIMGLAVTPQDEAGLFPYVAIAVGSKLVALAAAVAAFRLYEHWHGNGQLQDLTNLANEE